MEKHALNIYPTMLSNEFEELVADIAEHGLLNPITLHEGAVLDGWNRYLACLEADVEPKFINYQGKDALAFVISTNIRRNLTSDQKAAIAATIAMTLTETKTKEQSNLTKGTVPGGGTPATEKPNIKQAAKQLKVDDKKASKARYVKEAAEELGQPEIFEKVKTGEKTLEEAATAVNVSAFVEKHKLKPGVNTFLNEEEVEDWKKAKAEHIAKPAKKSGLLGVVGGLELVGLVEAHKKDWPKLMEIISSLTMNQNTKEYLQEYAELMSQASAAVLAQLEGVPDTIPEGWE